LSPFPVDFLKFLLNLGKHPLADQKDFPTWNFQRWGANISLHSFTNVLLKRPTRLQEKKKKITRAFLFWPQNFLSLQISDCTAPWSTKDKILKVLNAFCSTCSPGDLRTYSVLKIMGIFWNK
jgi:hypothetical protein